MVSCVGATNYIFNSQCDVSLLVNFPVVSGGFALLAGTGVLGTSAILPVLGAGLGLLGVGGAAAMMCVGPQFCTTSSGQCCLLAMDPSRPGTLVCPVSCQS